MINPGIKVREIIELILKKYKCKSISSARRGKDLKLKAVLRLVLKDHYGMLWSYASEILNSNQVLLVRSSVTNADGKYSFVGFFVFLRVKEGWLEGCRRVIGLDGCFLKTICKGELLSAVGRDGNNQIYPIAWSKEVMPLAEHRQCAKHIYANFRKKFTWVQYRNLFWKAAKATYPAKFEQVMKEINDISNDRTTLRTDHPESWSRAFFTTDKACDAVENGISECFNALIVDARRKPIINMLEDIRVSLMERMQRMREKHVKWNDVLCPNIIKKFEILKDLHRVSGLTPTIPKTITSKQKENARKHHTKDRWDASEGDRNRTRVSSKRAEIHCSASGGVRTRGGSARGGSAKGGSARGRSVRGGSARGWSARGGFPARGGVLQEWICKGVGPTSWDGLLNIRVILFSIHSEDGNPSSVNIKQHCGRYKRQCCSLTAAESDSLPHPHTQATKTYYKHQDSRIKKA
ncbi:hypothetical protein Tco_1509757 [Tanacetum coccineum]